MLEVITAPEPNLVNLLETLEYLGVPVSEQDPALAGYISRASAAIVSDLGYNPNAGAYKETIETGPTGSIGLMLSRFPINSIASLKINDEEMDPTSYRVGAEVGMLIRITAGLSRRWEGRSVVTVEYEAGFDPLPQDIKLACLRLIESGWAARGRDPGLRNIGIGSISLGYFAPDASAPGIASVADLLAPYRMIRVG